MMSVQLIVATDHTIHGAQIWLDKDSQDYSKQDLRIWHSGVAVNLAEGSWECFIHVKKVGGVEDYLFTEVEEKWGCIWLARASVLSNWISVSCMKLKLTILSNSFLGFFPVAINLGLSVTIIGFHSPLCHAQQFLSVYSTCFLLQTSFCPRSL